MKRGTISSRVATLVLAASLSSAQTFKRLGSCPTLGCVLPPDQTEFLAGQLFDIRLEVHAPLNGTEASRNGVPDEAFTFCIRKSGKSLCEAATKFFGMSEPKVEKWSFKRVF